MDFGRAVWEVEGGEDALRMSGKLDKECSLPQCGCGIITSLCSHANQPAQRRKVTLDLCDLLALIN